MVTLPSALLRLLVPVLLFSLASCGDDDGDLISTPQVEPAPQPGEGGEEEEEEEPEKLWSRLYLKWSNDIRIPEECVYPRRFKLYWSGRYRAGPCEPRSNRVKVGEITRGELQELRRLANLVVESAPSRAPECDAASVLAGEELEMRLPSGRSYDIYELSAHDGTVCYRGGRANVVALLQYIDSLEQRYYPERDLTNPSPTPTVTVTATPAPTPTITVTPSPTPTVTVTPTPTPTASLAPEED